jgi:hypothetical protein
MRAEALSRKNGHIGAIAFSWTGDLAASGMQNHRELGDVPDDLKAL